MEQQAQRDQQVYPVLEPRLQRVSAWDVDKERTHSSTVMMVLAGLHPQMEIPFLQVMPVKSLGTVLFGSLWEQEPILLPIVPMVLTGLPLRLEQLY